MFEREELLKLFYVPGIGPNRFRALIGKFGTPEDVFKAPMREIMRTDGVDEKTARNIKLYSVNDEVEKNIKDQLKLIEKSGAKIVSFWDEEYPENLKNIYDPPALLFVKGSFKKKDKYSIAIVGSRNATEYGKIVAEKLSNDLVKNGISVISGLARGIDTSAHKGAITAKGRTIAVMGSGIDVIYPPENKKLTNAISENGALISENPMGTQPDAHNFPRRNRIISGISLGTVVVEAGERSGALITAAIAIEQNREIFAVPGNIYSSKSLGTNMLIKKGEAKLVQKVEDILVEIENLLPEKGKNLDKSFPKLNQTEEKLFLSLSEKPIHIDELAKVSQISTAEALATLLTLELMGIVKQLPGKNFIKVY